MYSSQTGEGEVILLSQLSHSLRQGTQTIWTSIYYRILLDMLPSLSGCANARVKWWGAGGRHPQNWPPLLPISSYWPGTRWLIQGAVICVGGGRNMSRPFLLAPWLLLPPLSWLTHHCISHLIAGQRDGSSGNHGAGRNGLFCAIIGVILR